MWTTRHYGNLLDYLAWWVLLFVFGAASLILIRWRARVPTKDVTKEGPQSESLDATIAPLVSRADSDKSATSAARIILGNLAVTLTALTAVGLIAETYLRFVSAATDPHGITLTHKRWHSAFVKLNTLASRDKEWSEGDRPEVRRIALVGDSFTFGWGIDDPGDRFSDRLQRRFEEKNPGGVEVMNFAWGGWSTADQIPAVRFLIDGYGVDEVVLCYLPNDIDGAADVAEIEGVDRLPLPRFLPVRRSYLLDYLYYRIYVPRAGAGAGYFDRLAGRFQDPDTWRRHAHQLSQLAEICRERGVVFRVAILPLLQTSGVKYQAVDVHRRLSSYFLEVGIEFVDLLPVVNHFDSANLTISSQDPHPNEAAHQLWADAIWATWYE